MLATFGVGGGALFATLNRMGANLEKLFSSAPDLTRLEEGAFGRITGELRPRGNPVKVPGLGQPCAFYEHVMYVGVGSTWRVVERELVGGELEIAVGDSLVRVQARDIYIVRAPSHDQTVGTRTSRVRYVPVGATVQLVGTLTREVDADPAAQNDYREIATRFRLVGNRRQPVVLAADDRV